MPFNPGIYVLTYQISENDKNNWKIRLSGISKASSSTFYGAASRYITDIVDRIKFN